MIENFNNFRIRCGLSTELLDQNGQLKAGVKVDLGCWYLCIDTACVYICIADANNPGKAKLELLNAKNFAGKSELSKYAELAEVYTKGEIDALGFISEIPDEYLTLEQLNTELDGRGFITEHQSLANYATKAELLEAIKAIPQPDLTEYAKKSDIPDTSKFITEIPDNYVTEETLANKGYLTSDSISGLASTDYVDEKFAAIEHPLTGLATEEFVTEKIAEIEIPDVSNFATKDELPSVAGLATETFVHEMIAKAELDDKDVDLDAYYTKEQIDTQVADLATKDALAAVQQQSAANDVKLLAMSEELVRIDAALETIPSIEGLASEQFVTDKINDLEIPSIAGLASETYVGEKIAEIPLGDYALKSELPSIEGLATEKFVTDQISAIPATDLSKHATIEYVDAEIAAADNKNREDAAATFASKDDIKDFITLDVVNEQGFLTEHQSLEDYAKKSDLPVVPTKVSELENDANYLTEHQSLDAYATKEDVTTAIGQIDLTVYAEKSALVGLATEEFVTTEIAKAQLADKDVDLTGYAKESFVTTEIQKAVDNIAIPEVPTNVGAFTNDAGYITLADIPPVDLSGKADVSHTHEEYALAEHEHDKYLTEHQDISGKADKEHTHEEYALKSELPSTAGLATEDYVASAIAGINIPEVPTAVSAFTNDAGYISADALNAYATADHAHEDLATKTELAEAISNIQHPQVDFTGYATEEWVEGKNYLTADDISGKVDASEYQADKSTFAVKSEVEASLASKLDSVLFTENYLVKNPIGNFAMNAPVMGMSLKDILINMLGLELYVAPSLPDNVPEETPPAIGELIANTTPVYTLNGSGQLVENTDTTNYYVQWTEETAKAESNDACFYQIVDSETNELIESGYQIPTVEDSEDWMTVAIPETVTKFHVEQFNPLTQKWERVSYTLEPYAEYSIDGYKVYTADGTDGGPTIRIIIEE